MKKDTDSRIVVVTGDVTLDWNFARIRKSRNPQTSWNAEDSVITSWQRGGSALLGDLILGITKGFETKGGTSFQILQTGAPDNLHQVQPDDPQHHHLYVLWSQFKYGEKPPADKEKPAWRVEEFLGLHHANPTDTQEWQKVCGDSSTAELVVLDDAGLGFRDQPDLWPAALHKNGKTRPWILVKMATPVAQGPLWEHLHREFPDRLIVVTTVDALRSSEVQISRELSWERTAQDVFWELIHNPCVNSLSHCAHVVISFGPAGAILLTRQEKKESPGFQCTLFFDPKVIEGMWEQEHKGGMIGDTTCLAGSLARQLMLSPEQPDIFQGIQNGLAAIRTLHLEGYGERGATTNQGKIVFPLEKITNTLSQTTQLFTVAPVQDPMRFIHQRVENEARPSIEGYWTILNDHYQNSLDRIATQVVLEGPESALLGVPWGQFGNLLTVDRHEIESFRSIRNLVYEYCKQSQQKRPLSVAVFGSPGSGKSFGIIEIANSLLPGQIEVREFNLSQFDSVENLISAFHQVRDINLGGKIPLIFWDEFDTSLNGKPLGWLRYFLAPMQDGKFQEGQLNHPIGRSIFVFAGGTSFSMATFGQGMAPEDFKAVKGPDFISRLKGFINVLGPNPVLGNDPKASIDPYFILRRAIVLRSSLQRNVPTLFEKRNGKELLNIDPGVLRALLRIDEFKHGARSIESVIAMSQLAGETSFERSCLPPESQLNLHVDGQKFLSMVQQVELDGKILEDLAEAAHEVFSDGLRSGGFRYGPKTDEKLKTHSELRPYSELSEDLKEQNRKNVRDIPAKLAAAHYVMIPARSNEAPFNFPGKDLELLAKKEHERWMRSKLADGWAFAPETDKSKKRHMCLVPWEKLSESERVKDRDLVRGIPEILAKAGYAVVKESAQKKMEMIK
jgi:hypothetical protein